MKKITKTAFGTENPTVDGKSEFSNPRYFTIIIKGASGFLINVVEIMVSFA